MKRILLVLFLIFAICVLSSCEKENISAWHDTEAGTDTGFISDTEAGTAEDLTDPPIYDGFHESLIAHAGGAVYGYRLTNSLEALEASYENGFRIFELDFERTSDGKYVLLHDWESMAGRMFFKEGILTLAEFHASDTFEHLTLLDLDMLIDWLSEHEGCYIITDSKCGNQPFLYELYKNTGELSQRFIPQAYSYEEYNLAKEIGFENVLLTLYQMDDTEAGLLAFAERQQPWAVTIPKEVMTRSLVSSLTSLGIYTYAHTVNDLSFFEEWREYGLYGIYTDYFCPIKWPY